MNKWLVIHSTESFSQHDDLIGCKLIEYRNRKIPKTSMFMNVEKEDLIIYYATGKMLIGVFKVISDMDYLKNDLHWDDMAVYRIEPILIPKSPPLITELLRDPKNKFDLFKKKNYWGSYLQGKLIRKLSENDFNLFYDFIKKHS